MCDEGHWRFEGVEAVRAWELCPVFVLGAHGQNTLNVRGALIQHYGFLKVRPSDTE